MSNHPEIAKTSAWLASLAAEKRQTKTPLEDDAGAMYDILSQLVDALDDGKLKDHAVRDPYTKTDLEPRGATRYLIDDMAREIVERHETPADRAAVAAYRAARS